MSQVAREVVLKNMEQIMTSMSLILNITEQYELDVSKDYPFDRDLGEVYNQVINWVWAFRSNSGE